jgi:membrane associated rhomboid family serine protease
MTSCSNILSGWLFGVVECVICVFIRYMELRLFMNIYVVFVLLYVIFSIIGMANSSALKMF